MVLRKVRQLCFAPMERRAGVARSRCMRIARCAPRASPALLSRRVAISARATQSRCSHKGCACACRTREERETACLTRLCPSPLSFPPPPPRLVAARPPTPQYRTPLAVGIFLGTVVMMSQMMLSLFAVFVGLARETDADDDDGTDTTDHVLAAFYFLQAVCFSVSVSSPPARWDGRHRSFRRRIAPPPRLARRPVSARARARAEMRIVSVLRALLPACFPPARLLSSPGCTPTPHAAPRPRMPRSPSYARLPRTSDDTSQPHDRCDRRQPAVVVGGPRAASLGAGGPVRCSRACSSTTANS